MLMLYSTNENVQKTKISSFRMVKMVLSTQNQQSSGYYQSSKLDWLGFRNNKIDINFLAYKY